MRHVTGQGGKLYLRVMPARGTLLALSETMDVPPDTRTGKGHGSKPSFWPGSLLVSGDEHPCPFPVLVSGGASIVSLNANSVPRAGITRRYSFPPCPVTCLIALFSEGI
jgi:hypothetical protein